MKTSASFFLLSAMAHGATLADAADLPETQTDSPSQWKVPSLVDSRQVCLQGPLAFMEQRGWERIGKPPYTVPFLRADLSFEQKRWFTNYSGDISGRFLELASLATVSGIKQPRPLAEMLETVPGFQKADGHYGGDVDWQPPLTSADATLAARRLPIFWGNARLLVGLLAAFAEFKDDRLLDSAKKIGDFYVATADRFCDPAREEEYRTTASYAAGYSTCYFHGIEGLVLLHRITREPRYLQQAERMAGFSRRFDTLPLDHAHGNLSMHRALVLLFEDTGRREYLDRALQRWNEAVAGGNITPLGGVGEGFQVQPKRDEGCALTDWLRLNLELWRVTGQTCFLDMGERLIWNQLQINQFPSGGYGHCLLNSDRNGVWGIQRRSEEAVWCCNFHGPLGMLTFKQFLAVGTPAGVYLNFPVGFSAPVTVGGKTMTITSRTVAPSNGECMRVETTLTGSSFLFVRKPDWSDEIVAADAAGKALPMVADGGYMRTASPLPANRPLTLGFRGGLRLEDRRFKRIVPKPSPFVGLHGVVFRHGPRVLCASGQSRIPCVAVAFTERGEPRFTRMAGGGFAVVCISGSDGGEADIVAAASHGKTLRLQPWPGSAGVFPQVFVFDVAGIPVNSAAGKAVQSVDAGDP